LNDILIRQFQKALDLSRGEASFIQIAFYLAYFIAAIPAGIIMKKIML
jgi:FHS family L-fucose permease-like MFS transporter